MKKMKYIYAMLAVCAGLMSVTSCNDSLLEQAPQDRISDATVWKTPEHLKLYVNNFYNGSSPLLAKYDGYSNTDCPFFRDAFNGSDIMISNGYNSHMNGETTVPENNGGWAIGDWSKLRNINYFFANYKKVTGDEAEINRYVGEALFFRSLFYFDKLRTFGDVPYYDVLLSSTDTELLNKPRDARNVVVQHLMDDLDNAVNYLPSRKGKAWDGRLNKETAMLLQARIALYEGTWEKYHAGTPFGVQGSDGAVFLQKAAAVTDALIALGSCELDNVGAENGYWKLFNQTNYSASNEVLFWRQYEVGVLVNKWERYINLGGGCGVTKKMVDSYLCTDGKPIESSTLYKGDASLKEVVANRDPRLNQTIGVNDGKHLMNSTLSPNAYFLYPALRSDPSTLCVTGYQFYKGHNPAQNGFVDGTGGMIYFRYAEALLINAEAKAELGACDQGVLDRTVNKLRDRVGMAHLTIAGLEALNTPKEFPDLSYLINEIRRERKVELIGEGFRLDDIFRWAGADELVVGYVPLGAKKAQWLTPPTDPVELDAYNTYVAPVIAGLGEENGYISPYKLQGAVGTAGYQFKVNRDYLRPLPITERVLNPALKQNPGWDR
ncbi:MAG: RagB/SusD family nutrient uptake outer membrane protein [Tannerellaceae bacterium]|nr:RagB/SusD family nutrient uptake outer membrane protein [Tannerellaceae bacterium]